MQAGYRMQEEVSLDFKRYILEKSAGFVSEPMTDLYRVHLLGMMLNRYDELLSKELGTEKSRSYVLEEFADIAARMREEGFEAVDDGEPATQFPRLSEAEAERYISERDGYMHKTALGVFLCTACLVPLMLCAALSEALYVMEDILGLLGMAGMFAMIGTGVYAIVTAVKPKKEKQIRKGRFSLTRSVRLKLEKLREKMERKARKRRGRGIALCVTSLIPILLGAMLSEIFYSDVFPLAGVAAMFLMIGTGVYELVMADGEQKTIGRLLKNKE